ncbi:hypothetical protein DFS34DRAFT_654771 [Phlyctochytrium arcticum]|nr:hypothetical protein DFS34DRAFT_654771 [Phlyctochytrium arcticum]
MLAKGSEALEIGVLQQFESIKAESAVSMTRKRRIGSSRFVAQSVSLLIMIFADYEQEQTPTKIKRAKDEREEEPETPKPAMPQSSKSLLDKAESVEEEEPASATPQEEAPTITTNINQSLAVRLSTGRSIEEVIVAWREGVKDGREHCVHSWIVNLNDAQLCNYATPQEIKEIKAKWLEGSPAASSLRQMARGQYDSLDSQDLLAAYRYLDDLTSKIPGHFTAASVYEHETGLPIRREGEHVQTHMRTLIVREMVISMLRAWTHGTNSSSGSEALVMRQSWDSLFDRLAFGVVKTGAAEETVMASAYRRKQQGGSQQRGKQADKCWRTSNGYELCWQEAAKGGAVADWSQYIADSLKIYKGCKDLSDFITMRTRKSIEVGDEEGWDADE